MREGEKEKILSLTAVKLCNLTEEFGAVGKEQ